MGLLVIEMAIIGALLWLWMTRRSATAVVVPKADSIDLRPSIEDEAPSSARIQLVLVEADHDQLLLDCALAEPFGAVPAGQPFTMVVRIPHPIAEGLSQLFERWSSDGAVVEWWIAVDLRGPQAYFVVDQTVAMLELVASSPLRGAR
jgi:hypothetical protein